MGPISGAIFVMGGAFSNFEVCERQVGEANLK
jgi:hypothetical protein